MDLSKSDLFEDDDQPGSSGLTTAAEPAATPPPSLRAPLADGDDEDPPERPRRRWLLLTAVVPWVVLTLVLVGGGDGAASPEDQVPPDPEPEAPGPDPVVEDTAPAEADATTTTTEPDAGHFDPRAVGVATAAARTWLSTHPGQPTSSFGHDARADQAYVEHLAVETVDQLGAGHAVITLHGLILPVVDDAYGRVHSVRVAVPVGFDTGEQWLAGQPYHLPTTQLRLDEPRGEAVDDPDLQLQAAEAVSEVGYRQVELLELTRVSETALVARVRARAPGRDETDERALWLRTEGERLVVAGTTTEEATS